MTNAEIATKKKELESLKTELEARVRTKSFALRVSMTTERLPDELDNTVSREERNLVITEASVASKHLNEVETALEFIKIGIYGLCDFCGDDITPKRLAAVPWARYCVTCQDAPLAQEDDVDDADVLVSGAVIQSRHVRRPFPVGEHDEAMAQ